MARSVSAHRRCGRAARAGGNVEGRPRSRSKADPGVIRRAGRV